MADDIPFASVKIEGIDMVSSVDSIDVEDHDRAIDRARVVFEDGDERVAKIVREQSKIQVFLGWSKENAKIFEGIVMSVKTEAGGAHRQKVTVTAYDLSYRMKQTKKGSSTPPTRRFDSGKLSDAIKAIVGEYAKDGIQLGDVVPDPDPTFSSTSIKAKPDGQTDWDFIADLATQYQARTFVEVNGDQSKFYFVSEKALLKGDPMGTLYYCPGSVSKLLEFKYQRVGSGAAPASSVTVIDPQTGAPVTKSADPPPPEAPLDVGGDADAATTQAADSMAKATGSPDDARPAPKVQAQPSDPARAEQKLRQDPTRILGYQGNGTMQGSIMMRAKGKVTIKGISPWAEGDWYVHKVNHVYTRVMVADKDLKQRDRSTFITKFSATR